MNNVAIAEKRIPKTKNPVLADIFRRAFVVAGKGRKGTKVEFKGFFGESGELLVHQILQVSDLDTSWLTYAAGVDLLLQEILLDSVPEIDCERFLSCISLCFYGMLLGAYDREDFRYVYRYSLWKLRESEEVADWLRSALIALAAIETSNPREVLSKTREWVDYLGAPLWSPQRFSEAAERVSVDISAVLLEDDFRVVDNLSRYPSYIGEAIGGKRYDELRKATGEWLAEPLSSQLLASYRKAVYKDSQAKLSAKSDVGTSVQTVRRVFEDKGFRTSNETVLPIRLQELPTPPPPEAIDPVIFEMIPQKLRVEMMASVAYWAKTKKIEIFFLGGPEIGRSGILVKTDTGAILMDYGLSVSNHSVSRWIPELDMVDCVLVTHSHLDHVGGLPVLYENYTGKWCSVGETGAISMMLLDDALKVGTPLPPRKHDRYDLMSRFNQTNIDRVSKSHVKLEYNKTSEVAGGIMVTPIDASHIPGSASYLVDIEGTKILYTGDFNMDSSVLFPGARLPTDSDITIFDGTYWAREDFNRDKVAAQLEDVVRSNGPIIIPSFAVGRSQEVLMLLEKLGITERRNVIVAGMAEQVTKVCGYSGGWTAMKKNKVSLDREDILVAGGGMMGGGLAREQFKEHRNNPEAAVVLCGYLARRTPGWNLLHGHEKHTCRLEYARLSAHTSATNLRGWVESCSGRKVIVHTPVGEPPMGVVIPGHGSRIVLDT